MNIVKIVKVLVIALFLLLVMSQADKKFVLDEIDFPIVSKATSETGSPIYYRGEDSPNHIGIYHPTLYINSLALFIKIFGYSENSVRAFGAVCALLTSILIIGIYRLIVKKENRKYYFEIFFLSLFLLNPYTIANVTVPDIDTTVLPITLLLFIYAVFYFFTQKNLEDNIRNKNIKISILILSLLLALNFWAKMTTSLLLPVLLFIWLIINKNSLKNTIIYVSVTTFIGIILFTFTYWFYCFYLQLPFEYTFSFLLDSFTKGTAGQLGLLEKVVINLEYGRQFLYWITIPLTFMFFVSMLLIFMKNSDITQKALMTMGLFGFFVTIFYVGLISPFAGFFKYPFATFSLVIFPIAFVLSEIFHRRFSRVEGIFFVVVLGIISFMQSHFVGDSQFKNRGSFNYVIVLIIASIMAVFLLKKYESKLVIRYVVILIFATTIGVQIGISRVQAISDYPTKYNYGQTGLDDAVTYLKVKTKKNEPIWSMKDVGYYVHNRYYENYSYFFNKDLQSGLVDMLKNGEVRYYVVTTGIGQDRIDAYMDIKNILDTYAKIDAIFGNFIIYKSIK